MPNAITELLGSGTPQCRVLTDDIEIHWWDRKARSGSGCLCGVATRLSDDEEQIDARIARRDEEVKRGWL